MSYKHELLPVTVSLDESERDKYDTFKQRFETMEEAFWKVIRFEDEVRNRKGWISDLFDSGEDGDVPPTRRENKSTARALGFYESRLQLSLLLGDLQKQRDLLSRDIANVAFIIGRHKEGSNSLRLNVMKGMSLLNAATFVLRRTELLLADTEGLAVRCQAVLHAEYEDCLRSHHMPPILTEFHRTVPVTKVVHL
jgi:hypothetical protein